MTDKLREAFIDAEGTSDQVSRRSFLSTGAVSIGALASAGNLAGLVATCVIICDALRHKLQSSNENLH